MSWCDKLASTPSVGIWFSDHYVSSGRILDSLSPIFDKLVIDGKPKFTLNKSDAFSAEISTEYGFQYGITPSQLSVSFGHRLKIRQVSGGPPTVDMLSDLKPYSKLLPDACEKLLQATSYAIDFKTRLIKRIGIVSSTSVSEDELPPGVKRLISYLGRPWPNQLKYFDVQLVTTLKSTSGYFEQCVHHITKSEGSEEKLIVLKFDWQKTYVDARTMTLDSLRTELDSSQDSALKYFEELAIGNMFDEEVLNAK